MKKLKKVGSAVVPVTKNSIRNSTRGGFVDRYKSLMSRIHRSAMPEEDFDSDVRQTPKKTKPATSIPFVRVPSLPGSDSDDDE